MFLYFPFSTGLSVLFRCSNNSTGVKSSTSFPRGALNTFINFTTLFNSLNIKSPPLSPSRNADRVFVFANSTIDGGMLVPSTAIVFSIPALIRFSTSALPSTTNISSDELIAGPAGHSSFPNDNIFLFCVDSETSFNIFSPSLEDFEAQSLIIPFARSAIASLFIALTSSIEINLNCEPQGPTLSICSTAATINDTIDMSVLIGITTFPLTFPFSDVTVISILPTFQFF